MCEELWILILEWLCELCAYTMGLHYIYCILSLHLLALGTAKNKTNGD